MSTSNCAPVFVVTLSGSNRSFAACRDLIRFTDGLALALHGHQPETIELGRRRRRLEGEHRPPDAAPRGMMLPPSGLIGREEAAAANGLFALPAVFQNLSFWSRALGLRYFSVLRQDVPKGGGRRAEVKVISRVESGCGCRRTQDLTLEVESVVYF